MSCKYLCQVGALKYARTCSDRCEFPCWRCSDRTFRRQWPTSSPPGPATSTVPGHCPLLPLRDPVIESVEHGVYFGCASETGRWKEWREREGQRLGVRKRQIKRQEEERREETVPISTSHFSTGTTSNVLIYAPVGVSRQNPLSKQQASGQKTFADVILYNVGLWDCASQLCLFTLVSSSYKE